MFSDYRFRNRINKISLENPNCLRKSIGRHTMLSKLQRCQPAGKNMDPIVVRLASKLEAQRISAIGRSIGPLQRLVDTMTSVSESLATLTLTADSLSRGPQCFRSATA